MKSKKISPKIQRNFVSESIKGSLKNLENISLEILRVYLRNPEILLPEVCSSQKSRAFPSEFGENFRWNEMRVFSNIEDAFFWNTERLSSVLKSWLIMEKLSYEKRTGQKKSFPLQSREFFIRNATILSLGILIGFVVWSREPFFSYRISSLFRLIAVKSSSRIVRRWFLPKCKDDDCFLKYEVS